MALLFFPWILPYFFIGHTMTWIPSVVVYEKKVVDVVRRNTTMLKPQTDVSSSVGGQEPFWNPSPTLSPYVGEKVVALTFDDGPNGKTTERLLDILKMERVSVTFFIVGNRVTHRNISVLKRASDEGHEIGNHSWSHPRLTHLSGEQITREIAQTNEKIYEVTGK